jgi:hypothetical protein
VLLLLLLHRIYSLNIWVFLSFHSPFSCLEKIKSDDTTEKLLNPLGDDENRNKEENDNDNDDDDGMEQEEMFVMADVSFGHSKREWGGPRRGGRLAEPTRFGDWERKGRCTDF